MSDTPTPAQDSAEQLKRDANEIRSGTMSPPEMALKLVIVMRRAINRVEELEQQQRHGAEALETLEKVKEWCREFNGRLFEFPSTGDTCSWCHAESNEGRHRSNCPKTLLLAAIDGS